MVASPAKALFHNFYRPQRQSMSRVYNLLRLETRGICKTSVSIRGYSEYLNKQLSFLSQSRSWGIAV